jgi:hypothetical protein
MFALKRHIIGKELMFEFNLFVKSIVVLTKNISNSETMSFYVGASFVIKESIEENIIGYIIKVQNCFNSFISKKKLEMCP